AGAANISTLTLTVTNAVNFGGIQNGNSLVVNTGFGVTNLILDGSGSLNLNAGLQGFAVYSNKWNTIIRVPITGTGGFQSQSGGSHYISGTNSYSGGTSFNTSAGYNFNNGNVFGTGAVTNSVTQTVLAVVASDSSGATFATAPITVTNTWQAY